MSYLASVKDDLMKLVGALHDELSGVENAEDFDAVFKEWSNELWKVVEQALKTSYMNGKSGKGDNTKEPAKKSRFANWKQRPEGQ